MQTSFLYALASVIDANSTVLSGATATFQSLAGVAQELYTDTDLITPATTSGVLTANSSGRFSKAFFDPSLDYKCILKDSSGSTITTINPIFKASGYATTASLSGYLQKAGGTMTGAINFAEGSSVASDTTIDLDAATGNMVHITGTTTIQAMTLAQGAARWLVFDGACTIYHTSTLILPGSYNITTAAGDMALVIGEGSSVTRMFWYQRATGKPLIEPVEMVIAIGDETTAITAATSKITFRNPISGLYLSAIPRGSLTTAQASGNIFTVDINRSGGSILVTKLTIDNAESTSESAATPCTLGETVTFSSSSGLLMTSTADFPTFWPVQFSNSGGALPTGISASTTYYTVRVSSTTSRLSTSLANAIAGTVISYTDAGTGTNSILPIAGGSAMPIPDDAQMTVDVDQIGTSGAAGLKIVLRGYRRN